MKLYSEKTTSGQIERALKNRSCNMMEVSEGFYYTIDEDYDNTYIVFSSDMSGDEWKNSQLASGFLCFELALQFVENQISEMRK